MKIILTFLLSLTLHLLYGQKTASDTSSMNELLDLYVNRQFDSLESNVKIDSLEKRIGLKLNSISNCINPFTSEILNDDEIKFIKTRLEEIAFLFYREQTPIIISIGGSNSVEIAKMKNKTRNKYNVIFISLGNGCVTNETDKQLTETFNNKTLMLLGVTSKEKISK